MAPAHRRTLLLAMAGAVSGMAAAAAEPSAAAEPARNPPRAPAVDTEPALTAHLTRTLWLALLRAHAQHRVEDYIALHSRSLVMVLAADRSAWGFEAFAAGARSTFQDAAAQGGRIGLSLGFTARIVHARGASEQGVARVAYPRRGAAPLEEHFAFHVVSRPEHGHWRVLTWFDAPSDAEAFAGVQPLVLQPS